MQSILDLNHTDARRSCESGAPVYLLANPVEYHGPHLSLHNDSLVSQGLARDLHARLSVRHPEWELLLATDHELGVEPAPGLGSRRLAYALVRRAVLEACGTLADMGARRVILLTFHGSPLHNLAIEAGVKLLTRLGVRAVAPFNLVLAAMVDLDPTPYAPAYAHVPEGERDAMMRELPYDFHAGFFETSMALHYAPASVSPHYGLLPPCPEVKPVAWIRRFARIARASGRARLAQELELAAVGLGWSRLRPFPGYTGCPHHATPEAGELFARAIVDRYEPVVKDVLLGKGTTPPPIMPWVARATLGGRVGRMGRLRAGDLQHVSFPDVKAREGRERNPQDSAKGGEGKKLRAV